MTDISSGLANEYNTRRSAVVQSQFAYSSHREPLPVVTTFNSEWVDTPIHSPAKGLKSSGDMSMVTTSIRETTAAPAAVGSAGGAAGGSSTSGGHTINMKPGAHRNHQDHYYGSGPYETPSKQNNSNYITPISESKSSGMEDITIVNSDVTMKAQEPKSRQPKVTFMDILWEMLNSITGKDKMAKVGQYTLRLLIYHAQRSQKYLSDTNINIKIINQRYNNGEKQLNLFRNFIRHPQNFTKIVAILVCSLFTSKAQGMVTGLATYRQFLRFGKTPFRVRELYNKVHAAAVESGQYKDKFNALQHINSKCVNKQTLGQILSLYYGINDESLLLCKLNVVSNPTFREIVARHESLAWYYESVLAIYNCWENLKQLGQQEVDLKIQIQVRKRAKILSKQILGGHSLGSFESLNLNDGKKEVKMLREIQFKKKNTLLELYKSLSDFVFNTYTVFHLVLPFDTLQIWMGISASMLSCVKLYRESKKALLEKAGG